MNRTLKWRIKFLFYIFIKIIIEIIPIKSVRQNLRDKLNIKFYKETAL